MEALREIKPYGETRLRLDLDPLGQGFEVPIADHADLQAELFGGVKQAADRFQAEHAAATEHPVADRSRLPHGHDRLNVGPYRTLARDHRKPSSAHRRPRGRVLRAVATSCPPLFACGGRQRLVLSVDSASSTSDSRRFPAAIRRSPKSCNREPTSLGAT